MMNNKFWSRLVLSTALAGGLMFAFGTPARADRDNREGCKRRLEADRARIDRDSHRYGEHSRQVNRDVAKMDQTRNWCRNRKADWDHDRFDIGIYFRH
jgi:hypothetical protein